MASIVLNISIYIAFQLWKVNGSSKTDVELRFDLGETFTEKLAH
jgi:hypothetical protein